MKESIQFLQAFLKNPGKVGSITPSSDELALEMLSGVKPSQNNIILELGCGTGAITRHIQKILPDQNSYLGVELDQNLVMGLNQEFSDLQFVCGDARNARNIHRESGLGRVGYVICGLPFVLMPAEIGEAIWTEVDGFMDEGCMFRTFQYAHGYYMPTALKLREHMRTRYGFSKRSKLVVKNVPPAFTLTWHSA